MSPPPHTIVRDMDSELVAARLSDPISATWEARIEETDDGTRMTFHMVAKLSGLQAS
ncbi:MAG: hypothetical protein V3U79_04870 [Dehalococcoidia bacterium]